MEINAEQSLSSGLYELNQGAVYFYLFFVWTEIQAPSLDEPQKNSWHLKQSVRKLALQWHARALATIFLKLALRKWPIITQIFYNYITKESKLQLILKVYKIG